MPTSTKVKNLNINELTEAQYDAAVQGGVIGANELSVLTDVSYVEPSDLATVATTGDYSDLINRPTNLVSTNTAQTISGMKTFSGDITLSGTTSIKNNTGGTNYTMLYRDASTIHVGASTSVLKLEGSGTRPAYNSGSLALLSDITGGLPSQTGHSGEFLTTDGTDASWAAVNALPSQTGQSGKFLTTDGTDASWATVGTLPSQTGQSGKFLTTDGTDASWAAVNALQNTATGTNSLTILGTATTSARTINIGTSTTSAGDDNIVIGYSTSTTLSWGENVFIGNSIVHLNDGQAPQKNVAIGYGVSLGGEGVVIGNRTKAGSYGVAVGSNVNSNFVAFNGTGSTAIGCYSNAKGNYSVAIGYGAKATAANSIQISAKSGYTNSDANTFKVANENGNFEIMSADGTIPTARLTKVNSTITLAAADWSVGTQTVTVNGVTSTSVVWVSPDPSDQADYVAGGILCTAQAANSLTFTASTTPTNDIDVVVVAM